jgi:hypothetical protein
MRLMVDGTPHKLATCESFYLASHVPHGVKTIENTRVPDTVSAPRDQYLALDESAAIVEARVLTRSPRCG